MNCEVTVRKARPADINGIYRVTRESWQEAYSGILSPEGLALDKAVPQEQREWLQTVLDSDAMAEFVAASGGIIVGFGEFLWMPEKTKPFIERNEAELRAIYVVPDRWGRWIGTQFLDHALQFLPEELMIVALSTLADNERARDFYERRGFRRAGTTTTAFGGDTYQEVIYRRSL